VEEVEQEKDEGFGAARVGCRLNQAERGDAVGTDAAQLTVEISLPDRQRCHRRSYRRVFVGPVEPRAGQQPDRAPVEPGMHPVSVELDLVEPLRPIGRLVDQSGELRFDPGRQRRRLGAPLSNNRSRHLRSGAPGTHRFILVSGSDRLDQAGVIIFDVSDPRAHRPADHLRDQKATSRRFFCA